jgi:tetratricopeptide (TPR) repeat protein
MKPQFIGRADELRILTHGVAQAGARHGSIALVEGAAGLGKTTLVTELLSRIDGGSAKEAAWAIGYCYEGGTSTPYYPWIDAVSQLATHRSSRDVSKLTVDLIKQVGPDLLRLIPVLGDAAAAGLKALSVAGDWWLAASPKEDGSLSRNVPMQFADTIIALAKTQGPLLLVVEDAHWMDAASAELLLRLSHTLSLAPLHVVVTYRKDAGGETAFSAVRRELLSSGKATLVGLQPFTRPELFDYLKEGYGPGVAGTLTGWLHDLSGGQPLFVSSYLSVLEGIGALELSRVSGEWSLDGDAARLPIPLGVSAVLEARLERLTDDERALLRVCAVQGQKFYVVLASELLGLDESGALALLRSISRREDLVRIHPGDAWSTEWTDSFTFSNQLVQQVLYSELTEREKASWHRRIGLDLKRRVETSRAATPVEIRVDAARHLRAGRAFEDASALYLDAARLSYDSGAFRDAAALCEHALDSVAALGHDALDAHLRMIRARSVQLWLLSSELRWWGAPPATTAGESPLDLLKYGDEDAEVLDDPRLRAQMTFLRARVAIIRQALPAALTLYERALEQSRAAQDELGEVVTMTELGHHRIGVDLQEGLRTLRTAYDKWQRLEAVLEASEAAPILARHLHRLQGSIGVAEFDAGHFDEGETWLRAALDGLRLRKMPDLRSTMSNFLAQLLTAEGRFEESEQVLVETLDELKSERGAYAHRSYNESLLGKLYLEWRRGDLAETWLTRANTDIDGIVNEAIVPLVRNYYCEWLIDELNADKRYDEAEQLLRGTIEAVERSGFVRSGVTARVLLSQVLMATDRSTEALALSTEAVETLDRHGVLPALRSEEVLFNHYTVLRQNGVRDQTLASRLRANRIVQQKAASIGDESRRYQFLHRVPLNRRITNGEA